MSNNPYTSPQSTSQSQPSDIDANLEEIAKLQRLLNLAILCYIGILIISRVLSAISETDPIITWCFIICISIFNVIIIFRLASRMYGTGSAIIHAIGGAIPIISIFILAILSGRATIILKKGGYKVGLLGAKPMG